MRKRVELGGLRSEVKPEVPVTDRGTVNTLFQFVSLIQQAAKTHTISTLKHQKIVERLAVVVP